MADLAATRPLESPPAPLEPVRGIGEIAWRLTPEGRSLIESFPFDWAAPREGPGVRRIKKNGQRDVWRIERPGGVYFLKRYRNDSPIARLKTLLRGPVAEFEADVGEYAERFAIAAVRPVACAWRGTRRASTCSMLITAGVPGAMPLCDYWLTIRDDPARARATSRSVARLVARAHQCGFHHLDMHAGNIIVQTEACPAPRPLFVDLHDVRTGAFVSLRSVVANLAQLNQWFRRHATRTQRLRFLRAYLEARDEFAQASPHARNWTLDPRTLLTTLARAARRHAEWLWAKRDRRSMRSGRYFSRVRAPGGWSGHAALVTKHPRPGSAFSHVVFTTEQWREWLRDPLRWVDPNRNKLLKDSHSVRVLRAALETDPPLPIIVKQPIPRSPLKRLLYALGPSRTLRAWRRANMLLHRDLPAAQALAIIERRGFGLWRSDSILLTEFVADALDVEAFLVRVVAPRPVAEQRAMKNGLIQALVGLVFDLGDRGFVHRDFKAPNVLVRWPDAPAGRPQLTLIDMDGIFHRGGARIAECDAALVRLAVSLGEVGCVTRSDLLRTLRLFLIRAGQLRADWKQRWRDLARRASDKRTRKAARREWKLAHYGRE